MIHGISVPALWPLALLNTTIGVDSVHLALFIIFSLDIAALVVDD